MPGITYGGVGDGVSLGVDTLRLTSPGEYKFIKSLTDKRWYALKNGSIYGEGMGS